MLFILIQNGSKEEISSIIKGIALSDKGKDFLDGNWL